MHIELGCLVQSLLLMNDLDCSNRGYGTHSTFLDNLKLVVQPCLLGAFMWQKPSANIIYKLAALVSALANRTRALPARVSNALPPRGSPFAQIQR